jgi:acetyltransferase-like isoleucine patch superfamily enzyme
MISFFLTSLNKYLEKKNSKRLLNLIGEIRGDSKFYRGSNIELSYGSTKKNISIGERFWLRGVLSSQYGGKISIGNYCNIGKNTKCLLRNNMTTFVAKSCSSIPRGTNFFQC